MKSAPFSGIFSHTRIYKGNRCLYDATRNRKLCSSNAGSGNSFSMKSMYTSSWLWTTTTPWNDILPSIDSNSTVSSLQYNSTDATYGNVCHVIYVIGSDTWLSLDTYVSDTSCNTLIDKLNKWRKSRVKKQLQASTKLLRIVYCGDSRTLHPCFYLVMLEPSI